MYSHWERQQAVSRNMHHLPRTPSKISPTPAACVSNTIKDMYHTIIHQYQHRAVHGHTILVKIDWCVCPHFIPCRE